MISERLRRARLAKGLSLDKLAKSTGEITKQAIHKYEAGKTTPSSDVLIRLAKALDVKVEYFFRPIEVKLEKVNFRRKADLFATERKKLKEIARDHLERYLLLEESFPPDEITAKPFKASIYSISQSDDAEKAAIKLRKVWELGLDPIENMTELLEEHGIKVIEVKASAKFDSLSGLVDAKHAFIMMSSDWPGERQRFTLAHELGHLALDITPKCESKYWEACCHRFAAAFLAPAQMVLAELGRRRHDIPYPELLLLKEKYGLSMAAWIMRARDLGIISQSRFLWFYKDLNRRGWRIKEPVELKPESPTRFKRLLLHALAEGLISESKASDILAVKAGKLWKEISKWTPRIPFV